MVFCYKIITESPRRAASASPRRAASASPRKTSTVPNVSSSVSHLLGTLDYECSSYLIENISETDWRLLNALAKKREEEDERARLADDFRRMWQKEKEEREIVEAETNRQYKRYMAQKRREDQYKQNYRQLQKSLEFQQKRRELIDSITDKEQRSAETLALLDNMKINTLIDKALVQEARAYLAADRRSRLVKAEQTRKEAQLLDAQMRAFDAEKRKKAILRDCSQRVAINSALSSWECNIVREEVAKMEEAWRAHHATRAALTSARSMSLAREREAKRRRGRKLAAYTAQLRDIIMNGRKI